MYDNTIITIRQKRNKTIQYRTSIVRLYGHRIKHELLRNWSRHYESS